MSSNVAVYSTDKLSNDTSFVNNFLDDMIERYCESRYSPNTVIPRVEFPTLDQVVSESYPGYYKKAPGLYASYRSTHVIVVYEADMQETLNQALEHKFSRLFVQANLTSNKLVLVSSLLGRTFPLFDVRRQMTDYFKKRALYKLKYHDLESVLKAPKVFFAGLQNISAFVYKPDLDFAKEVDAQNRLANEKLIDDLYFFDIKYIYTEGFNAELAFAITNGYFDVDKFFSPAYADRLRNFSAHAISHIDDKFKEIKDRILREEALKAEEERHQKEAYERARRHAEDQIRYAEEQERRLKEEQQRMEEEERLERMRIRQEFTSSLQTSTHTVLDKNSGYYQQKLAEKKVEELKSNAMPYIFMGILFAIFILLMIFAAHSQVLGP